jgi:hypothetical protein
LKGNRFDFNGEERDFNGEERDFNAEERMRDCSWTRVVTVGRPENNSFSHPRAIESAGAGMREAWSGPCARVGTVTPASGTPVQRDAFGMLVEPAFNGGRT